MRAKRSHSLERLDFLRYDFFFSQCAAARSELEEALPSPAPNASPTCFDGVAAVPAIADTQTPGQHNLEC